MAYKLVIQKQAEVDIVTAYEFIVERGAPLAAAKWYQYIKAEIETLSESPSRWGPAREAQDLGIDLRQFLVRKRSSAYRIIFLILEDRLEVHILAVRHAARKALEAAEFVKLSPAPGSERNQE